jgi:hypothetical protein
VPNFQPTSALLLAWLGTIIGQQEPASLFNITNQTHTTDIDAEEFQELDEVTFKKVRDHCKNH